jgi:hypothetical protein
MPINLFQDGDILTADSVNQYFMDQALIVFDDATDRNNAFNATPGLDPTKPDLQEGRICYLKSDNKIYIYTGAAWTPQLALIESGVVTSDNILDGAIMNIDINANAQIALTKLANGNLPTGIKVASANITDLTLKTEDIEDDAVTSDKLGTNLTLTGTTTLDGATKIEEIFEKASIVEAQPVASNGATLTLTISDGAVYYYTTSTTRNVVLDIVTTGMLTLQAVTVMVAITSGSTAGKISEIKVNGVTNTAKWFGGNPLPNGSGGGAVDAYTITVFRKDSTYTVFASQSKFA